MSVKSRREERRYTYLGDWTAWLEDDCAVRDKEVQIDIDTDTDRNNDLSGSKKDTCVL